MSNLTRNLGIQVPKRFANYFLTLIKTFYKQKVPRRKNPPRQPACWTLDDVHALAKTGRNKCRQWHLKTHLSLLNLTKKSEGAFAVLMWRQMPTTLRSLFRFQSAQAEDLQTLLFRLVSNEKTYLNVKGLAGHQSLGQTRFCSLFNDRAFHWTVLHQGFEHQARVFVRRYSKNGAQWHWRSGFLFTLDHRIWFDEVVFHHGQRYGFRRKMVVQGTGQSRWILRSQANTSRRTALCPLSVRSLGKAKHKKWNYCRSRRRWRIVKSCLLL